MRYIRFFLILPAWLLLTQLLGQGVTYGFVQDINTPTQITAVAYPDFTSNNVTISTAVFTFLLPEGTITDPSIPPLPGSGAFNDITGTWNAQLLTPTAYQNAGFDPNDLQGNDVYQVVLQNSPSPNTTSGVPIQLFSFELPSDCMNGNVEVLTNNSSIQQAIVTNLMANFNNQMSVSIDDAAAADIYAGNDPVSSSLSCPLNPMVESPDAVNDIVVTNEDMAVNIDVLANDDFGGDGPSTTAITIVGMPVNGTAAVDDNGTPNDPTDDTIDYVPDPDYNGPDSFTYEICDADGDCNQATVTITVNPVNDLPVAVDDNTATNEDMTISVDVLTNDDFGGDGPSTGAISVIGTPANGTATVNNNGTPNDPTDDTVDYIPDPDYNGPDSFTYEICDANGDCDQATVNVTVNPVDDAPNAVDDIASVNEDASVNIPVVANDDFGGDGPSIGAITIIGTPANGTATVNDNGTPNDPTDDTVDYTPDPDYNGPDSFTYEICDADGDCDQATANVTVTPGDDAPDAVDDVASVDEDASVNIPVVANDDFGGDGPSTTAITIVGTPTNGTATVNDNGTPNDPTDDTVDYTPDTDYNGGDSFSYEICDANGSCDQATVTVTVNPVDDAPDAVDDVASVDEDAPVNIPVVANDDFGGDGPSVTAITIVGTPTNGTATVNDNGTPNDPTDDMVDYTPAPDYNGGDSFTYEICDADGDCDQATVNVTVDPVDDAPDATDDMATTNENMMVSVDVLNNDDFGGDGPSVGAISVVGTPANGTATVDDNGTPNDPTDDTINYMPDTNFDGSDSFIYEICDADGDCDQATVNVTVNAVANEPIAIDDNVSTNEDMAVNIDVLNNDNFGIDGPSAGPITVVGTPANGTAVVDDNGTPTDPTDDTIDYTPAANFNGPDSFTYEICDANGDCDQATANVTVNAVNDLPVAVDDNVAVNEDMAVSIDVLNNDDFGGDGPSTGAIMLTSPPGNGTAMVITNGTPNDPTDDTITYIPAGNFNGSDSFTYQICDADGDCDQATVNVTVNAVNDLPIAVDDNVGTNGTNPVNIPVLNNDSFGGDGPSTGPIMIASPAGAGAASVNNNGTPNDPTDDTINYTPAPNFNGNDSFTYQICDSNGDCDQATVVINVNQGGCACNDPLLINCPADVEYLECMAEVPDPDPDALVANFACSGTTTATLIDIIETGDNCSGFAVTHIYEVTNGCRVETCEVTYYGQDFGFPTGGCPQDVDGLTCVGDIPDPDPEGVAALFQDNCGTVTGQLLEVIDDTDDCSYFSRTYVYQISDECGRSRTCDVTYSGATQMPYSNIIGADDLTCIDQVPPPDEEWVATHFDTGCGDDITAKYWSEITNDQYCSGFVTSHFYMIMSACGSMIWAEVNFSGTNCPGCGNNNGLIGEDDSDQLPESEGSHNVVPEFPVDALMEGSADMDIYPNPTTESVNILLTGIKESKVELKVYSVYGALVYDAKVDFFKGQPIQLNLERLGLSSGTYMIQVVSEKNLLSRKIVLE